MGQSAKQKDAVKHSPLRSFHDWFLGLLHAARRPFAGPTGAADTPAPAAEDSEFVPTVPWRVVFAAGE